MRRLLFTITALLFALPAYAADDVGEALPALPPPVITQQTVIDFTMSTAPTNPATGHLRLYADSSTGALTCVNTFGGSCLSSGGGGGGGSLQLQVNGTPNGSQALLNLAAGSGTSITDNGTGTITISAAGVVTSVFGRTGVITATVGDYNFNQLSGTATSAQLPATTVYNNQANAFSAGLQDLSGATLKLPIVPAYTPTTAALFGYDSTNNRLVLGNGTNTSFLPWFTTAPTSGQFLQFSGTLGLVVGASASGPTLQTNGAPNGSQSLLNLVAGSNVTLTDNGSGSITIAASGGGGGPVTSVAQTVPSWLQVAGSPITTAGTLAISSATGLATHKVVGTCGTATTVSLCALVAGDLPAGTGTVTSLNLTQTGTLFTISGGPITTSGNINLAFTGTLPLANGGTGATLKQTAFNNLAPTPTRAGDLTYYNGSNYVNLAGNNSGTGCLQETSSGVPSWAVCGGGGGTPSGSNTQFQYNNAGAFGGANGFTWNNANNSVSLATGTITTDVIPLAVTWTTNNAATTFTGLKFTATNSAQHSGSLDYQFCGGAGGATCVTIDTAGNMVLPGTLTVGNGSVAGNWNFPQGPLPTAVANAWQLTTQTAVDGGGVQWVGPNAGGTAAGGVVFGSASAPVVTLGQSGDSKHSVRETGKTATVTNKVICLAADCPAGEYQLDLHLDSTVVCATPGPATLAPTVSFKDDAGTKTNQTIPVVVNGSATLATTMALGDTTSVAYAVPVTFWSDGTTNITITLSRTACTVGTATYSYSAETVQLR